MYTIAAKDERLSQLLRCGAPKLFVFHLKTEREEGKWAIRRFFIGFSRAEGSDGSANTESSSFPMVTGTLVLSYRDGRGVSMGLEEAILWLGEEESEPVHDEADCDAVALAFLLYVAGGRLVEIEEQQAERREILKYIRWLAGEGEREEEDVPE